MNTCELSRCKNVEWKQSKRKSEEQNNRLVPVREREFAMTTRIADGVWPTMITPFDDANRIDYRGLEAMIEWYIARNVHGLFAVCQSSEMFFLSKEERTELARFVKEKAAGRVPVIASGHVGDSMEEQIDELKRIAETGVDAVVLVSNRLAAQHEDEEVWKRNAERILQELPNTEFGIYECPYPYKRLLSPQLLKWCADTGRFSFLKDTCCNLGQIREKLDAVKGTSLKLFNANSTTLLESMKLGAAGFSGVMANFHPELYVWLTENWRSLPDQAEQVQSFIGPASLMELQLYPVNAKHHMQLEGLPVRIDCRVKPADSFTPTQRMEVKQLRELTGTIRELVVSYKAVRGGKANG
jgi:4-hydroxy-tetrahydrodipicolinate synthase